MSAKYNCYGYVLLEAGLGGELLNDKRATTKGPIKIHQPPPVQADTF